MKDRRLALIVKSRADFLCEECGSTENVQAHDLKNGDGISLCGCCHAKRHPDVPSGFIISKKTCAIWTNISAASLAKRCGVVSQTIIRKAREFDIPLHGALSDSDIKRLISSADTYYPSPSYNSGHPNGHYIGGSLPHPNGLYVPSGRYGVGGLSNA